MQEENSNPKSPIGRGSQAAIILPREIDKSTC